MATAPNDPDSHIYPPAPHAFQSHAPLRHILSAENFGSEIRPALRSCIWGEAEIRAIHIASPHGSGKSVDLVKMVWEDAKLYQPNVRGTYIQAIEYQARKLQRYFAENGDRHLVSTEGSTDPLQPSLQLSHYSEAITTIQMQRQKVTLPEQPLLYIVDMEDFPSVRGQVLYGLLITYLSQLNFHPSRRQGNGPELDITLVTLATEPACSSHFSDTLQRFTGSSQSHLEARFPPRPLSTSPVHGHTVDEMTNYIAATLTATVGPELDASVGRSMATSLHLVAFMPRDSAVVTFQKDMEACQHNYLYPRHIKFHHLHQHSTVEDIEAAFDVGNFNVVCVDPSFPVVLTSPAAAVVSIAYRDLPTLQSCCGHTMLTQTDMSLDQFKRENAWAEVSDAEGGAHHYALTVDQEALKPASDLTLGGQTLMFAYELVRHWGNIPLRYIPVPFLRQMKFGQINELLRQLRLMQCIERSLEGDQPWRQKPLTHFVNPYLDDNFFNPRRSVHVACLLGHLRYKSRSLSDPTKRVLIRLASILAEGLADFVKFDWGKISSSGIGLTGDTYGVLLQLIATDSVGTGQANHDCGVLWVAFALWQARWVDHGAFAKPSPSETVECINGYMVLCRSLCLKVGKRVDALEHAMGLSKLELDSEVESTLLDSTELESVYELLLLSYLPQQVFFSFDGTDKYDLLSSREACVDEDNSPLTCLFRSEFILRNLNCRLPGGFTAFYTRIDPIDTGESALVPQDLTFVPDSAWAAVREKYNVDPETDFAERDDYVVAFGTRE